MIYKKIILIISFFKFIYIKYTIIHKNTYYLYIFGLSILSFNNIN
jgi:hypothetical protein